MGIDPVLAYGGLVGGVGGNGGKEFTATNFSHGATVVKKLEVYKNSSALCGLVLEYTDGSANRIGNYSDKNVRESLTFGAGERVTFLGLWGNGVGSRCAGIRLLTNKGQNLELVVDKEKNEYPQVVSSGIMAGAYGRVGAEFDVLGFIFVRPIKKISITINDSDWLNNPVGTNADISTATVAQDVIYNPYDKPMDWSFPGTRSVKNSRTFTQSSTTTWGVSVEVSAGIFDIGLKTTASWEQASMTMNATTHEETVTIGTTIGGILQKGEKILCTSASLLGTLDLRYKSRVKIIVDTGATFEYQEDGEFKNAIYSYAETTYKHIEGTEEALVELRRH